MRVSKKQCVLMNLPLERSESVQRFSRKCYKDTTILLHDGSLALQSTSKKAKQTMEYYDKLDERLRDFVVSKTKITKELYEEKEDEEWYLFGDEALELGIVDEII